MTPAGMATDQVRARLAKYEDRKVRLRTCGARFAPRAALGKAPARCPNSEYVVAAPVRRPLTSKSLGGARTARRVLVDPEPSVSGMAASLGGVRSTFYRAVGRRPDPRTDSTLGESSIHDFRLWQA
jgi:hypothetical protein